MSSFYLKNRRYVLLTYAQSGADFDPWLVVDVMSSLGAECIVSRELHADGGIHHHVFVDFGRLFSTRKTDVFHVGGHRANILPIGRTPAKAFDYVCKDGDIVAGGLERPGTNTDWDPDSFWDHATHCRSSEEFLHLCDQLAPRDLIRGFTQFRAYAGWKFALRREPYRVPAGFEFDTAGIEGIQQWLSQANLGAGPTRERRKSLILFGPTRTGKTEWARSLGPHIYFGSQFSGAIVEDEQNDSLYAVFDDWKGGFSCFPAYKDWLGCMWDISVRRLHHDAKLFTWGRPCIWVCNRDPRLISSERGEAVDWAWMEGNCIFAEVFDPLFTSRASTE